MIYDVDVWKGAGHAATGDWRCHVDFLFLAVNNDFPSPIPFLRFFEVRVVVDTATLVLHSG